jgi:hypothetical protein
MDNTPLITDSAWALARSILNDLFWCVPEEHRGELALRLFTLAKAGIEAYEHFKAEEYKRLFGGSLEPGKN